MKPQTFQVKLIARGPKGAWTMMRIPAAVTKAFGTRARLAVAGSLNGFPYRSTLWPAGDGTHLMAVNRAVREGAKAKVGDMVDVVMVIDTKERHVEVPPELKKALAKDAKARAEFEALAYSHRKEYADWIAGAKQAETRERRIAQALENLREGKKAR